MGTSRLHRLHLCYKVAEKGADKVGKGEAGRGSSGSGLQTSLFCGRMSTQARTSPSQALPFLVLIWKWVWSHIFGIPRMWPTELFVACFAAVCDTHPAFILGSSRHLWLPGADWVFLSLLVSLIWTGSCSDSLVSDLTLRPLFSFLRLQVAAQSKLFLCLLAARRLHFHCSLKFKPLWFYYRNGWTSEKNVFFSVRFTLHLCIGYLPTLSQIML